MTDEHESGTSKLDKILVELLQRVESGESVDPDTLLRQHPEYAEELRKFFAGDSQDASTLDADELLGSREGAATRVRYLGDYELLAEIARGETGVVYKARQVNLDRTVALKMILSGQLASVDDVRRFHYQVEAAANLHHPGVVPIYEIGEHDGQHFFSMAFVDGPSLAQVLAAEPLPSRESAQLVQHVAQAIAYAHSHGVIHRDLKSANILLARYEQRDASGGNRVIEISGTAEHPEFAGLYQPKVTAFGLTKRTGGATEMTSAGRTLITPSDMPREQASGQTKEIGETADIYSLGAILYAALIGQTSSPLDTLMPVVQNEPPRLRQLNPRTPRDLEAICLKCLQKEPHKRYKSAQELADDLGRWLDGNPITARRVNQVERGLKLVRRHPMVSSLTAALTIALLAGAIIFSVSEVRARRAAVAEREARTDVEEERQRGEASERLAAASVQKAKEQEIQAIAERNIARRLRYAIHMNQAQRQWEDGAIDSTAEMIDLYRPQDDKGESSEPLDLRGWEWNHLWQRTHPELRRFSTPDRRLADMAISPDGTRVAATAGSYRLAVWDAASGELLVHVPESERGLRQYRGVEIAFSPDGQHIATGGHDVHASARIWDAASGKMLVAIPETKGDPVPTSIDFSPDGQRLAISNADGAIRVWDLAARNVVLTVDAHGHEAYNVAFSPDGQRLLSRGLEREYSTKAGDNYLIKLWNAETGELERTIRHHEGGRIFETTLSPSGRLIASRGAGEDGNGSEAKIWSAQTGELLHTLSDAHGTILFTPDEQRLITRGSGHSLKTWDLQSGELISELPYRREPGFDKYLLDPWGWQFLYAVGNIDLYALQSEPVERTINVSERLRLKSVVFAPEVGLFSASLNGEVALDDPLSGVRLKRIQTDRPIGQIAYSHDGWLFATSPPMLNRDKMQESFEGPQGIHIWDVKSGNRVRTISAHRRIPHFPAVRHLVFFPNDSRLLSIGVDKHVYVFDAITGNQLNDFRIMDTPSMFIRASTLSSDGRRLAVASSGQISIYEIKSGKQLQSWKTGSRPQHLKFSPDGTILATSDALWEAGTGSELARLRGHTSPVWDIAFSPNGRRLATTGIDKTCRLWDVETGQQVLSMPLPFSGVGADFSSDGHWLAVGLAGDVDRPEVGTLKVFDGRASTPEVQVDREALALVRFLIDRPLSKADVLKFVKSAAVSDAVKKRAAELADRLQTETDPQRYADAARRIALKPQLNKFQYQFALAQAETAHQLSSDESSYLLELGMAQFRANQFSKALETLNETPPPRSPIALAFLAMANHQLGNREQAAQLLEDLRESATDDSQTALLIDEVETSIQRKL
ncbi:protein kinase domain-containing protein [Aporhodopirellula aestuarii]|uniref:Protein kinase n=1 Tax=Aporhodopirellula aestuarii TaxID=2950107 RepID=A0ABT0U4S7_9BACT|nr:protein kinase [Aporhodopirellula aestuarii]MCM2371893.1 protein kinase [Aporhodopirellula aestuarii]